LYELSFLHPLDILPVEVIGHHETRANNPDEQQNLPDLHATLPMNLWWNVPALLWPVHAEPRFRLPNHPCGNSPGTRALYTSLISLLLPKSGDRVPAGLTPATDAGTPAERLSESSRRAG
jgi:hypothetical protein